MQAYIDDSLTVGRVLVFGGLIASDNRWKAFSVQWKQYLDAAGIRVFKMNKSGRKHAKRLYSMVCEHAKGGICFAIPITPLQEAADRYGLTCTSAANPYFWAYKGVIDGLARCQREWGLTEPVDFIFDERPKAEEKQDVLEGWDTYGRTISDEARSNLGRRPVFADDEQELPLQAADMWAWWCRKTWLENGDTIPVNSYPVPWGKYGDLPQLIMPWSAEDIDQELSRVAKDLKNKSVFFKRYPDLLK